MLPQTCLFCINTFYQQQQPGEAPALSEPAELDLLVGFLHIGAIRTLSAVVGLDGESVLLLQLAIQLLFGADDALAGGLVQNHSLEGNILPVNPEAANFT